MKRSEKAARFYRVAALLLTAVGTIGQLYAMLFGYDVAMCVYKADHLSGPVAGWILFAAVLFLLTAFFVLPKERSCRPLPPCGNAFAFLSATAGGAAICSSLMIAFEASWPYLSERGSLSDLMAATKENSLLLLSLWVALTAIPAGLYLILTATSRKTDDKRLAVLGFFPVIWMAVCLLRLYFDRNAAINDPLKTLLQLSLAAIMLYFLGELRSRVGKPGIRFRFVTGSVALLLSAASSVSTLTLGLMGADIVRGEWMMAVTELLLAGYIGLRLGDCYRDAEEDTPEESAEEDFEEVSEETVMADEESRMTENKIADVIVLAGQSNAVGVGHCAYLPRHFEGEELERFFRGYDTVQTHYYSHNTRNEGFARTTVGCCEEGRDTFGPEIGIADSLSARYPDRTFYLVKCAFGGTSLYHDWASPADRYVTAEDGTKERPVGGTFNREAGWCLDELLALLRESLAMLEAEGYTPVIRAFCWMQGEGDADPLHADDYGDRYRRMLGVFEEAFAPYRIGYCHVDGGISEKWARYETVNAFKRAFAEESEDRVFLDTIAEGLTTEKEPEGEVDWAHYDSDSLIKLGRMFADHIKM